MLHCPTCGERETLTPAGLEGTSVRALSCGRCEGVWIDQPAYDQWLAQRTDDAELAPPDEAPRLEADPGPVLRRCPACASILGRYRVAHDVPFSIDRCHHCRGIWLDRHEWQVLRSRGIDANLYSVFTDQWQLEIRRRAADEREEAYRRRVLGEDGVERLNAFAEWANGHPMRPVILAILMEQLGQRHAHGTGESAEDRIRSMREVERE